MLCASFFFPSFFDYWGAFGCSLLKPCRINYLVLGVSKTVLNVLVSYIISLKCWKKGNWIVLLTQKSESIVSGIFASWVPTRCVQIKSEACVEVDVLTWIVVAHWYQVCPGRHEVDRYWRRGRMWRKINIGRNSDWDENGFKWFLLRSMWR